LINLCVNLKLTYDRYYLPLKKKWSILFVR
jgi:hypothetical protein